MSKWTKKEGEMKILKVCKQKSKDPGRCIRKNNRFTMEYEYNVNSFGFREGSETVEKVKR